MWPDIGRRLHAFVDRQAFGVWPFRCPCFLQRCTAGSMGYAKRRRKVKKIKGRRVIGLLLILCLFISSLSLLASAAEPTKKQILVVVDLSDYQGDITGAIKLGNAEVELTAGQRNEFLIPNAGFSTSSVTLTDFPAGKQTENYNCWTVSGLDESYTRFSSSDHTIVSMQ